MTHQYQGHRIRCPNLTMSLSAILAPPSPDVIRDLIAVLGLKTKNGAEVIDPELESRFFLMSRGDCKVNEFLDSVKRYHASNFRALGPAANETRPDGTALWWPRYRSLLYTLFCLNVPRSRVPTPPAAVAASASGRAVRLLAPRGIPPASMPRDATLDVSTLVGDPLDPFSQRTHPSALPNAAGVVASAPALPQPGELPTFTDWASFEATASRLFDAYGCVGWTRRTMGQASVVERRPLVMLCLVCSSSAVTPCPDCRYVHYCSDAHRALDRPSHETFCRYLAANVTPQGPREGDPLSVFRAYDRTSHEADYGGAVLVGPHGCGSAGCPVVFMSPSNGPTCGSCRSAVFCSAHAHLATRAASLAAGGAHTDSAALRDGVSHATEAHPSCYELAVSVRARRAMALRGFRYTAAAEAQLPPRALGVLLAVAGLSAGRTAASAQRAAKQHEELVKAGRVACEVPAATAATYAFGPLLRRGLEALARIQQATRTVPASHPHAVSAVANVVRSLFAGDMTSYAAAGWFALLPSLLSRLTVSEAVAAIDGLSFPVSIAFGLVSSGVRRVGRKVRVSAAAYDASARGVIGGVDHSGAPATLGGGTREVVVARLLMVGADETEFAMIPVLHQLLHMPPFDGVDVLDIVMMGPRMPISTVLAYPHELCADCAAAGRRISVRYVSCYFDHYLATLTDHAPGPWADVARDASGATVAPHDFLQAPYGTPAVAPPTADVQCACDGPLKDTVNKGAPSGCSWCVPAAPPVEWGIDCAMALRPDVLSIFHGGLFIGTTTTTAGGSSLSDAIRDAAARWPGLPVVTTAYEIDEAVRQADVLRTHCALRITADICPNPFGSLFTFTTWINTIRCTSNLGVCVGISEPLPPGLQPVGAAESVGSAPAALSPPFGSVPALSTGAPIATVPYMGGGIGAMVPSSTAIGGVLPYGAVAAPAFERYSSGAAGAAAPVIHSSGVAPWGSMTKSSSLGVPLGAAGGVPAAASGTAAGVFAAGLGGGLAGSPQHGASASRPRPW